MLTKSRCRADTDLHADSNVREQLTARREQKVGDRDSVKELTRQHGDHLLRQLRNPQIVQFPMQNGSGPVRGVCGPHSGLLAASRHSSSYTLWGCCFSSRRNSETHHSRFVISNLALMPPPLTLPPWSASCVCRANISNNLPLPLQPQQAVELSA